MKYNYGLFKRLLYLMIIFLLVLTIGQIIIAMERTVTDTTANLVELYTQIISNYKSESFIMMALLELLLWNGSHKIMNMDASEALKNEISYFKNVGIDKIESLLGKNIGKISTSFDYYISNKTVWSIIAEIDQPVNFEHWGEGMFSFAGKSVIQMMKTNDAFYLEMLELWKISNKTNESSREILQSEKLRGHIAYTILPMQKLLAMEMINTVRTELDDYLASDVQASETTKNMRILIFVMLFMALYSLIQYMVYKVIWDEINKIKYYYWCTAFLLTPRAISINTVLLTIFQNSYKNKIKYISF